MPASVLLALDRHCVETAARRAHARLLATMLETPAADPQTEARLVLLARFLVETDFRALRTRHPELAGGRRVCVELTDTAATGATWRVVPSTPASGPSG